MRRLFRTSTSSVEPWAFTFAALVSAVLFMLSAGCQANPAAMPDLVAEHPPSGGPEAAGAESTGEYYLYKVGANGQRVRPALACVNSPVRGTVGFRRDSSGQLFAVAGEWRSPVDEGRYEWWIIRQQETGWDPLGLVAAFAIVVVVGPIWVAGLATGIFQPP